MQLPLFTGNHITDGVSKILNLTEAEKTRIISAAYESKAQLDRARAASAKAHLSPDGASLLVDLPALDPGTSGAIYDQFVGTLGATLGPDRLELFNEVAGENFEQSFDRFGLNPIRYELTLQPIYPEGSQQPIVEFKRHYVDATGNSTGWTTSQLSLADLDRSDPILAQHLPAQLKRLKGAP